MSGSSLPQKKLSSPFFEGPAQALFAAVLFGISPVLIMAAAGNLPPVLTAALLNLGSGSGLFLYRFFKREPFLKDLAPLAASQKKQLLGVIISGGILAPVCLVLAMQSLPAFKISVLLNLETLATTALAWLFFREHVGARVWVGTFVILSGALILNASGIIFLPADLLVVASCFLWGLDNNLTREIEDIQPSLLAAVKGVSGGMFNLLLAFFLKQGSADFPAMGMMIMIGSVCYGFCLVLFIEALRKIGSSRTGAYFATGPFAGMLAAVTFLREMPPPRHWLAGLLMLIGVQILSRERHEHEHTHEPMIHTHRHRHDEHHQHEHPPGMDVTEPHEHEHEHKRLTHSHPHFPDIHHRHSH